MLFSSKFLPIAISCPRQPFPLVAVVRDEEAMSPKQRTSCAPLRHHAGAHASDWRQIKRGVEACESPVLTAALHREPEEYQQRTVKPNEISVR